MTDTEYKLRTCGADSTSKGSQLASFEYIKMAPPVPMKKSEPRETSSSFGCLGVTDSNHCIECRMDGLFRTSEVHKNSLNNNQNASKLCPCQLRIQRQEMQTCFDPTDPQIVLWENDFIFEHDCLQMSQIRKV